MQCLLWIKHSAGDSTLLSLEEHIAHYGLCRDMAAHFPSDLLATGQDRLVLDVHSTVV